MLKALIRLMMAVTLIFTLLFTWQASITVASPLRDCWMASGGNTETYGGSAEQGENGSGISVAAGYGQKTVECAEIEQSFFKKSILALTIGSDRYGFAGTITRVGVATEHLFRWVAPERGVAFVPVQAQISPLPTPTNTPTPIPPTPTATNTPTPIPPTPTSTVTSTPTPIPPTPTATNTPTPIPPTPTPTVTSTTTPIPPTPTATNTPTPIPPTPTSTVTNTPTPIPPTPTPTNTPTPIPPTPTHTPTPDLPPIVTVDTISQTVQYSDLIARVTISAIDPDSLSLNINAALPSSLVLNGGCTPAGGGSTCSWQLTGQMLEPNGTYDIGFTISDGNNSVSATTQVVVQREDAVADYDPGNPSAVVVESNGGNSGSFSLLVDISEKEPDLPAIAGLPGDIGLAQASMALIPVGPGSSVSGICTPGAVVGVGYDSVLPVNCAFDDVPVNLYTVKVDVAGDYYEGESESMLVIYDPSLGFTTGGGWFMWPGTSDQTNFGFTVKYNRKGKNIQGNLLLIRKLDDGSSEIYRLKSNALSGLALGSESDFDWASFEGKATYRPAGAEDDLGNHSIVVYVEDRGTPGKNADAFWIKVLDKDGVVLDALSMAEPALSNVEIIQSGNIVVPRQGKGKKDGGKASSSEAEGVDSHFMSSFLPFFSSD